MKAQLNRDDEDISSRPQLMRRPSNYSVARLCREQPSSPDFAPIPEITAQYQDLLYFLHARRRRSITLPHCAFTIHYIVVNQAL